MISKNIDITDKEAKSHGARMASLLGYVDQLENANKDERPEVFFLNVYDEETGDAEMIALAESNPRAQMPMRHLVKSWPAHERPTLEQAKEAARMTLKSLGAERCLAKCSLQFDTDNVHLHIVLCTVNPDDQKMVKISYIEEKLHQAVALIEHKQGWEPEKNARYSVLETGELVKNKDAGDYELIRKKALSEKASRLERFTGQRSAQDIAQEVVGKVLRDKKVKTWAQFHARLADEGMLYKKARTGAMIEVAQGDKPVFVKASDADRKAALKAMEKRFGEYEDAKGVVKKRPIEPVAQIRNDPELARLHAEYEAERQAVLAGREDYKSLRERQKKEFSGMISAQRASRTAVFSQKDQFGKPIKLPFKELNRLRSVIASDAAKERAALLERQAEDRTQHKKQSHYPDFEKWLEQRGSTDIAERFKRDAGRQFAHGDSGEAVPRDIRAYRPLLIADPSQVHYERNGRTDFVDYGKRIAFDAWRDPVAIRAGMQLSAEKWPKGFALTGCQDFKEAACREAVEIGIAKKITNPELQEYIREYTEQRKQEKALAVSLPKLIQEKIDHERRIADGIQQFRKNHQPGPAEAGRAADAKNRLHALPQGGLANLSGRRLETLSARVLHRPTRDHRRVDSGLRLELPAGTGTGGRMNPIAAAAQYLDAVRPDSVRVTSVRQGPDGERLPGVLLTPKEGVLPEHVPFNEIAAHDARRYANGDREHVYFTPLSERMHHILIDDLDAARLAKLRQDGFSPAVVIETSPGNFQAIINVPKISDDDEINRQIDNRLTSTLNWPGIPDAHKRLADALASGDEKAIRRAKNLVTRVENIGGGLGYGDPMVSGGKHPHRIPGYANNKAKNLLADGTYRTVNIITASGGTCDRASALARELVVEFIAQRDRIRKHDAAASRPNIPAIDIDPAMGRRLQAAYEAQRDAIKKLNPTVSDTALDLMIAQRMRATGYASGQIAAAVDLCSRNERQGDDYGQRTAASAFSDLSNDTLTKQARYVSVWQELDAKANAKIDKIEEKERKIAAYEQLVVQARAQGQSQQTDEPPPGLK